MNCKNCDTVFEGDIFGGYCSMCCTIKFKKKSNIVDFGKHKGKSIGEVIEKYPSWVDWAIQNVTNFTMSKKLQKKQKKRYAQIVSQSYVVSRHDSPRRRSQTACYGDDYEYGNEQSSGGYQPGMGY